MSDGTTAVQVSPIPTEPEMQSFRTMLDRALNAIVQASELARVVEGLRSELDQLRGEIDTVRRNNSWLDEQLTTIRAQRDDTKRELEVAKTTVIHLQQDVDMYKATSERDQSTIHGLKQQLADAQAARDDYGLKHMEASDALANANAKLAKVQDSLKSLFPPEPVQAAPPVEVQHEPVQSYPQPTPQAPSEPPPTPPYQAYGREYDPSRF